MKFNILQKLVEKANKASDAYYNGTPVMEDWEFDQLVSQIKELEEKEGRVLPNSPTLKVGAPVPKDGKLPKYKHEYEAKSLDKTKDLSEIISTMNQGINKSGNLSEDFVVVMWKEDGATVQAEYDEGKLVRLATRGDGEVGSIITLNADMIEGLPKEISYKHKLVVRGEAVMSYDEFNRINDSLPEEVEKYRNARNLASASLTLLDREEAEDRHLTLKAFNLVYFDHDRIGCSPYVFADGTIFETHKYFSERLAILSYLGFSVVEHETSNPRDLKYCVDIFTNRVKDYPFPVDGLVMCLDNYAYTKDLPGTQHHPNVLSGYAFKWEDEEKKTVIREIEWSPSRTGLLNPVAIFDPVEIDGAIVQRASLHNLSIMRKMRIRVGDEVGVIRANLVIPQITQNFSYDRVGEYSDEEVTRMIGVCPTCCEPAEVKISSDNIETVYCPNQDCPEKMIGKFVHFCSRECMDIQGMSKETIRKLVAEGYIKNYQDFFLLRNKPSISIMPGFGEVSWKNMCESADKARTTDFVKFITALSIPNIGKGQAKLLKNYLNQNYKKLAESIGSDPEGYNLCRLLSDLALNNFNFETIDGFGKILSENLVTWIKKNFDFAKMTPEVIVFGMLDFTDKPLSTDVKENKIAGKSLCITGKLFHFANRDEMVAKIEELGGKFVSSVSSKTDYLINNDTTSTSGKNKKAKELNIPIISEDQFIEMAGLKY